MCSSQYSELIDLAYKLIDLATIAFVLWNKSDLARAKKEIHDAKELIQEVRDGSAPREREKEAVR